MKGRYHMRTKKSSRALGAGIIFLLLFIAFTFVISQIDVQGIGPEGSLVGLSTVNGLARDLIGTNDLCYTVSEWLGYLSLLVAALLCVVGLVQWISRRSLARVDRELLWMYVFFAVVVLLYILFEYVVINYRPVLEDGELAASYPSSHTVLVFSVFGMAIAGRFGSIFGSRGLRTAACWISGILIVAMIATRLISGVHWVTDIIGGLLLSCCVVCFYTACIRRRRRHVRTQVPRPAEPADPEITEDDLF